MGAFPYIDIEAVLNEKIPNKKIPKFAISLLKRIIHQDWMNAMLKDYNGKAGLEFAKAMALTALIRLKNTFSSATTH